ncbi:hypothetical protein ABK040_013048 [Willaertia magna]
MPNERRVFKNLLNLIECQRNNNLQQGFPAKDTIEQTKEENEYIDGFEQQQEELDQSKEHEDIGGFEQQQKELDSEHSELKRKLEEEINYLEYQRDNNFYKENESSFDSEEDSLLNYYNDINDQNSDLFSVLSHSSTGFIDKNISINVENIIERIAIYILESRSSKINIKQLFELFKNLILNNFATQTVNGRDILDLVYLLNFETFSQFHGIQKQQRIFYCKECKHYSFENQNVSSNAICDYNKRFL